MDSMMDRLIEFGILGVSSLFLTVYKNQRKLEEEIFTRIRDLEIQVAQLGERVKNAD
jgi:hypothetical protein